MDIRTTIPFHLCTTDEAFESELAPYLEAFIDQLKQGVTQTELSGNILSASGILHGGQASPP